MMNSPPFQTVKRHLGHCFLFLSFPDFGKHESLFRVQNFWPTQRSSVEKKNIFSSFIISELKLINTGLTLILENQKVILQHQKDIADRLQIDLKDPRPAIGTSRKFQKKAFYTLASFLGILMVLLRFYWNHDSHSWTPLKVD